MEGARDEAGGAANSSLPLHHSALASTELYGIIGDSDVDIIGIKKVNRN